MSELLTAIVLLCQINFGSTGFQAQQDALDRSVACRDRIITCLESKSPKNRGNWGYHLPECVKGVKP